jgi:hypothetical protein
VPGCATQVNCSSLLDSSCENCTAGYYKTPTGNCSRMFVFLSRSDLFSQNVRPYWVAKWKPRVPASPLALVSSVALVLTGWSLRVVQILVRVRGYFSLFLTDEACEPIPGCASKILCTSKNDRTCTECAKGFWLSNSTCTCTFLCSPNRLHLN